MNTSHLIDFSSVARQIVKLSDIRQTSYFSGHSLIHAKDLSPAESRYYSITALIATAIDPGRAGAVTKRLLPALDEFQGGQMIGLSAEEFDAQREVFVERFLRGEYNS
ncbi:MAG TPA: hypothetical protein VGM64_12750 [Lacunisphaera sp.]|jgi:hypothetical protein